MFVFSELELMSQSPIFSYNPRKRTPILLAQAEINTESDSSV
jgi:hypothetical protein